MSLNRPEQHMSDRVSWRRVWETKSSAAVPDFELDRGRCPGEREIENLSAQELVDFIDPRTCETLLDTGCGTGVNIARLHSQVKKIIGIDYAEGSVARCQKRIREQNIGNAVVCTASVEAIPLPNCFVDKVLCLSVLQYLDDREVRQALKEFVRVLAPGGIVVLHVKNLSSLYWATLWLAKKTKRFLGREVRLEYVRSYRWYVRELASLNCQISDYNSFNLLIVEGMPKKIASFLRSFELRYHRNRILRIPFIRRHGSELKIKARLGS